MSEQTETWRKLADRLAPDYMTCPALVEACDLIDQLEARLAAAEAVCDHVTYAFTGADNRFIFLAREPIEVRELGQAYNAWYDARPK